MTWGKPSFYNFLIAIPLSLIGGTQLLGNHVDGPGTFLYWHTQRQLVVVSKSMLLFVCKGYFLKEKMKCSVGYAW